MDAKSLMMKIDAYCAESGLARTTVCQWAFGSTRFYESLENAIERVERGEYLFAQFEQRRPVETPRQRRKMQHLK